MKRGRPPKPNHALHERIVRQFHMLRRKGWKFYRLSRSVPEPPSAIRRLAGKFNLSPERIRSIVAGKGSEATFYRALPKILAFRLSKWGAAVPQKRGPGRPRPPTFVDPAHTPAAAWVEVEPPLD